MTRENITDILCIGCQKGSTSWLHSVLNSHPKTHSFPNSEPVTSTVKEAHFWDWNHHRGVDWYRELMTPPVDPSMLSMDFTPEYAYLTKDQIAECKALNPTARVIYILRDPLARAVSALRMHMLWRYGKDHAEPLHRDEAFFSLMRDAKLALHGDYLRNVTRWRAQYPDLILLNYEDFHTDRAGSVDAIYRALGLDLAEANSERIARLMGSKVWASEKFPMDRAVLMFLQGLTWRFRLDCERELGMRFAEGERLLSE
ncbi:sulfotransferase domain-containing protein [Cereibacter sphaeroides]|nr:sulfotransferase domain-containing protein [Cereibacter sphaeroides]